MKKLFVKLSSILFIIILISINIIYAQNESNNSNQTNIQITNITNISIKEIEDLKIIKFFPKEVKNGDVQFNIQVQNNKNETIENVFAIVKGKGFSTYDIVSIDKLEPYEKDYIFVNGNLAESGEINLTIILGKKTFYQKITVFDIEKKIQDEEKTQKLNELSKELEKIKKNYIDLELTISDKKEENYDLYGINLEDLKKYIRNIESNLIIKNSNEAEANLRLAIEEYNYQKNKIDNAKPISIITRIKENALIITTFISTILAIFALSELLRKKGESTIKVIKKISKRKGKKNN